MKIILKYYLLLVTCCYLLFSCAQPLNPSGGPKDTTPPRAMNYMPDSAAVNFKSKTINIAFDEYIQLRDLQRQIIISPPLEKMLEVRLVKNKIVNIEFQYPLKEKTTYTINFGSAIADIHEGNAAENFQYFFSTGSHIDSLSVSGKVQFAFDHKTEKGILVMLYDSFEDSVPSKKLPSYFAKTKTDGTYKINNIRPGKYKAFVLKDANVNYKFDSPEEPIGFCDTLIDIKKNETLNFDLFKELPESQKLKKAYVAGYGHLVFVFAKPTNEFLSIRPLNFSPSSKWYFTEYNKAKDTLHYWLNDFYMDSLKLQVSESGKILDTAEFHLIPLERAKKNSKGEKFALSMKTNVSKDVPFDFDREILLTFHHLIREYDSKKTSLKDDSGEVMNKRINFLYRSKSTISITPFKYDKTFYNEKKNGPMDTLFVPVDKWKENTIYHLFIPPGTFTDIFGLQNDTIKIDFKTREDNYYGTLKLKISVPKHLPVYTLQLLDEKENVMKEEMINDNRTLFFNYLHPGKYKLKLIYDDNGSLTWDTGNYLKHVQPEKVIYYNGDITVRSNWDLELEWKIEK